MSAAKAISENPYQFLTLVGSACLNNVIEHSLNFPTKPLVKFIMKILPEMPVTVMCNSHYLPWLPWAT